MKVLGLRITQVVCRLTDKRTREKALFRMLGLFFKEED